MKRNFLLTTLVLSLASSITHAQYNHENLKIKSASNNESELNATNFDLSFKYKNLQLFPIIANETFVNSNRDLGKFTLLKEAIESNKILITETGAAIQQNNELPNQGNEINRHLQSNNNGGDVSGTVNTLFAKNISTDTIFIMAGEVVKGGKQDRVIGQDLVLAPGQEVNLSAFCVEHNRWQTTGGNNGQFNGYFNVSSMDIRKIVTEEKNQSEVWNKVDEHTSKNEAGSETKTYTNLANSEEYQKEQAAYLEKFKTAFLSDGSVIGVIAVSGNEVIGCDMFATHQLFSEAYATLLYSYIGHAITNGSEVAITNEKVYSYLDEILRSEENQKENVEQNGTVYEYRNKKLHMTKY